MTAYRPYRSYPFADWRFSRVSATRPTLNRTPS